MEIFMKKLYERHPLISSSLILCTSMMLSTQAFAQENPANLEPVRKEPHILAKCQLCIVYAEKYNIYTDKVYDAQQTLREIEIELYEDDQFIKRDYENIDNIRAAG